MTKPAWFPDWNGETVVIVASGPSAADAPLDMARGKARFIAINNSWRLAPWADILYACDVAWWDSVGGAPAFGGLKMTVDHTAAKKYPDLKKVICRRSTDKLVVKHPNVVGWGGNSGFHCLNLAVQFGCSKVILVGYDMTTAHGLHWHGAHPSGMNNPTERNVMRWRRAVDDASKVIKSLGVKVINCSPISALQKYPKMSFAEALAA